MIDEQPTKVLWDKSVRHNRVAAMHQCIVMTGIHHNLRYECKYFSV